MRAIAILNRHAGTLRTMDLEAFSRDLRDAFAAEGHSLDCRLVDGRDVVAAIEAAAAEPDCQGLIVAGGDGTVSAAAGIAWKSGLPLGVIPAGTMNLFARAIGLPLNVADVPAILARWQVRAVDICEAEGHSFIHQFSAGMHVRMIRLREKMPYRSRFGKMAANIRASVSTALDPPQFDVAYAADGKRERLRVSAVSVSNNTFGPNPLLVAERLDGGHLGLYFARALNWRGALRLAFDILRGKLKENISVRAQTAEEVVLHFPGRSRSARCVIDGELLPLPREIHIRIHPGALKILAPGR